MNKIDFVGNDKVYLKWEYWLFELLLIEIFGCFLMLGWLFLKEVVYEMMLCDGGIKFMDVFVIVKCLLFLIFNKYV